MGDAQRKTDYPERNFDELTPGTKLPRGGSVVAFFTDTGSA